MARLLLLASLGRSRSLGGIGVDATADVNAGDLATHALHHAHGFVHPGVRHVYDHIRRAGVVVVGDDSHGECHLTVIAEAGAAVACRNLHRSYGGNGERRIRSVDRSDTGDPAAFAVDLLLVLEQLVEGDEAHAIAALVQAEVVEPGDLHPEGAALFAGTHTLTGDAIAGDLAETGGLGARSPGLTESRLI